MSLVLGIVALGEAASPQMDELLSAWKRIFPDRDPPAHLRHEGTLLVGDLDGAVVAIAQASAPLTWSELEGPCAMARTWPAATAELRKHRAHWVVTASANRATPCELWLTVTRLIAACALNNNTVGVYWPVAGLVHEPEQFVRLATTMSREQLPLQLWVDFRVGENPDGSRYGFTTGLQALDHLELEVASCHWAPSELVDRLYNIAHYVLDRGPVLRDGETIGTSAEERITIEHVPSLCGDGRLVINLRP